MWDHLLRLGGNELVNTARVVAIAETIGLPLNLGCGDCASITDMQDAVYGEDPDLGNIEASPWYDEDDPASGDFFGVVGQRIRDVMSSMREVPVTQRLGSGGVLGRERDMTRDVRATVLMVARNARGIDYGVNWLSSALSRNACGQHSNKCGLSDLEWLVDCPPDRPDGQSEADYVAEVAPLRRLLHDVGATGGPTVLEERENDCYVIYEVEFTITAQEPKVFGVPKVFELEPDYITGKSDVLRNLVRNPSTENTSGRLWVMTNYVHNPSFEVNTSYWSASSEVVEGTAPPSGSGPMITRRFDAGGRSWVEGDYYGNLEMPGYETSDPTVVRMIARALVTANTVEASSWVGKPFRGGVRIYKDMSTQVWLRLRFRNSSNAVIHTVETERAVLEQYAEFTLESTVVPAGTAYINFEVVAELQGNVSIPGAGVNIDAAWFMEG